MVSSPVRATEEARVVDLASSLVGGARLPLLVQLPRENPLSDRLLEQISRLNKPWQFERTAGGELLIVAPAGCQADEICMELGSQLSNWVRRGIGGLVTGSSGGYVLGNQRVAAPDTA